MHDGVAVHLRDPHDAVEAESFGERRSVAVLLLQGEGAAGHAAERAGRESADEPERGQRRRPQDPLALDPRGLEEGHPTGVANARIAATIPASAPISQNRIVTFCSGHPMSSK